MQLHATIYKPSVEKNAIDSSAAKRENTPLIILHGLFGSNRNWHPIARSLSDKYIVYSLDLRNHGQSPHSEVMDYPQMAEDVVDYIRSSIDSKTDQKEIQSVDIIAHSMGGKVAMWMALSHPELIRKLVVVDIAPVSYQHNFSDVLNAFQSTPLEAVHSRQEADQFLAQTIKQKSLRQFLLQNLQFKNGKYSWRLNLKAIIDSISNITGFPDTQNVTPFSKRALFIGGGQSDYLSRENQIVTRKLFPKASFSTIKPAGHWLHSEQPELFKALVAPYLATQSLEN